MDLSSDDMFAIKAARVATNKSNTWLSLDGDYFFDTSQKPKASGGGVSTDELIALLRGDVDASDAGPTDGPVSHRLKEIFLFPFRLVSSS